MRGKCLCEKIEFEITGTVPKLYQCHCSLCRKQGGSASNTSFIIEAKNLRWVCGQEYISSYVKDTGFRSDFCAKCGSPVPNPLRNMPYVWVPAGLLDDADQLKIVAHLHVGSRASWDTISAQGTRYDTMPKFAELIELLHSKTKT
ncbi:MAG: GFA family protein [Gammaproteobacteria bacterium]|nr:GFA family protein [Gammaproteobacteria bacterium]